MQTVAQTTKYEALIAQVQQYQRKLLTAFPEAARIIDDPSSQQQQQQQTSPAPATAMSRTRRGTITIAKKVAAVGTLRKRDKDKDKDKDAKESPKSARKDAAQEAEGGEEDHAGRESTPGDGAESGVKEKEKEPVGDEQHSNDEANGDKEEKQKTKKNKKKKHHKAAKKECDADDAEREHQHKTSVVEDDEEDKPSAARCVNDTSAADVVAAEPSALASENHSGVSGSSSLDEVKAMRDKVRGAPGV
jgi:hypothetical protein